MSTRAVDLIREPWNAIFESVANEDMTVMGGDHEPRRELPEGLVWHPEYDYEADCGDDDGHDRWLAERVAVAPATITHDYPEGAA